MSLEKKIEKLAAKKQKIEQDLQILKDQRHQEVADALKKIDFKDMTSTAIVGMMVTALENATSPQKEAWQKAGQKFCRHQAPKKARSKKSPAALNPAS